MSNNTAISLPPESIPWLISHLPSVIGADSDDLKDTAEFIQSSFVSKADLVEWLTELCEDKSVVSQFLDDFFLAFPYALIDEPTSAAVCAPHLDVLDNEHDFGRQVVNQKNKEPPIREPKNRQVRNDLKPERVQPVGFSSLFKKTTSQIKHGKGSRMICLCQGRDHALVNNCLFCGKVVCEMEGSGPCLFCGRDVLEKKDFVYESTYSDVDDQDRDLSGYHRAVALKNKLLGW